MVEALPIEHELHLRLLLADYERRGDRIVELEAQIAAFSALEASRDARCARNNANTQRLGWAGPHGNMDAADWLEHVADALDTYHRDIGTEEGVADIVQVLGWASENYLDAEHLRSVVRDVRDALDIGDEDDIAAAVTARLNTRSTWTLTSTSARRTRTRGCPMADVPLLDIARLVLAFGRVHRVLAFLALTIANDQELGLDHGALAVLALVHDLPEVYAGDTNTALGLSPQEAANKAAREQAAITRLRGELGPVSWPMRALDIYEMQVLPEARFLRVLDKVLPKLTHALNGGAAIRAMGLTAAELEAAHATQRVKLFAEYPEWEAVLGPLFDGAARAAENACAESELRAKGIDFDGERERYEQAVDRVVETLREHRAAEEKAYSDAYGFGEGVPEGGGEPMRPGECQPRSKISAVWPGFGGEGYLPGAPVTPQPERYSAGFATGWLWRSHRWLDGHAPPAPFSNHGGSGWRWADMGMDKCACGGANRVRVGTIYLCAECRDILPGANGG